KEPIRKEFWGDRYGQLEDPYGVSWAINEPGAENLAASQK
ncbi:MAG: 3-demethylubiquinone-9 3-methyltransferase, partial [Pseudomonadota bacterium]